MSTWRMLVFVVLAICRVSRASIDDQTYDEGLKLKHLPDGKFLAHFEHVIKWNRDPSVLAYENTIHHYGMFPKGLAEVLGHYNVQELHLSLTRGKWRTGQWGYSPISSPPGAEFWVWFLPDTHDIAAKWKGLINGVSGLMCASLSSIDSSSTYEPPLSFRPHGAIIGNLSSSFLRYSALPREAVCTENLTPWSKLLPCGQKAGLGSLYAALKLYDSDYHSISIHFKPVCQDMYCNSVNIELYQTLTVVFRPDKIKQRISWSLQSLFLRTIKSHCPLAKNSTILVDITTLISRNYSLTPPPNIITTETAYGNNNTIAVYNINHMTALSRYDVLMKWNEPFVHRSGLERGGIITEIVNSKTTPIQVVLLEMVPWYLRILLHTMKVECTQQTDQEIIKECDNNTVLLRHFTPAKDRQRPYTIERVLSLPSSSRVTLSVQFLRAFLKWDEYPPDASHGFYVNSAVLTTAISDCLNCSFPVTLLHAKDTRHDTALLLRIHTEALLVLLPTPDFSMPYNVICFVSTVIAIGFGSVFNLTTKVLKPDDGANGGTSLFKRFLSIFRKRSNKDDEDKKND